MKILMVCLGNICRSPLAEGILKQKVEKLDLDWTIDSAGTSDWHNEEAPDGRSIAIAKENQIDITNQRSRKFAQSDYDRFDLILAMDSSNYHNITSLARNNNDKNKVRLIMNYLYPDQNRAVPDPYYDDGFPKVFEMLSQSCDKIIEHYLNPAYSRHSHE